MSATDTATAETRFAAPAIATDGVALHYRSFGSGDDALVLLTGGPGFSGDYFVPLGSVLADRHRVIVPDPRGTGRSRFEPWDPTRVSIDLQIADLETLRRHIQAERWTLVGHSWGGVLAMSYAARHPDAVRALVLIGSGGVTPDYYAWYGANVVSRLDAAHRAALGFWQAPENFSPDPERAVLEINRAMAPAMLLDPQQGLRLTADLLRPESFNPRVLLALQPWLMGGYDLRSGLAALRAPALVVQGRQDPVGESTARGIAEAVPGARLHFIENAAHWPFLEQETVFLTLLREFLADR